MPLLKDFKARSLTGEEISLGEYDGKVALVVNTATNCGLSPQLEGLERLYGDFRERGLVVLGFPCNQFANQEPRDADEIGAYCQRNYGVTFPMFDKIDVNGDQAHPLFSWLREEKGGLLGDRIKWNFTKFLIGRDGRVLQRYAPTTKPEKIAADIEAALG